MTPGVGSRRTRWWRVVTPALLAVVVLATACGGGDDGNSAGDIDLASSEEPAASADVGSTQKLAEVAPSLLALGGLAQLASEPVTVDFDTGEGSFEFADGAAVSVPAGAFGEPTEVTAVAVNLDYDRYLQNPPRGRVYVLSTPTDIDLERPIILEVPVSSDQVVVTQLVDGDLETLEVDPGPTISVPIRHFSEVSTIIAEGGEGEPAQNAEAPDGSLPALFLRVCVEIHMDQFRGMGVTRELPIRLLVQSALDLCVRALIDQVTSGGYGDLDVPAGQSVSTSCVNDHIDAAGDIVAAVEACISEEAADSADLDDGADDAGSPPTGEDDGSPEDGSDQAMDEGLAVDTATYTVGRAEGQAETYAYEVASGQLDVSSADGQLIVSGTIVVDKHIWARPEDARFCFSTHTLTVEAKSPLDLDMVFRLETTAAAGLEYTGECENDSWTRNAKETQQWLLDTGPANMAVLIEDGSLVGSVDADGTADNLQRGG